jgi:hypothetical protein
MGTADPNEVVPIARGLQVILVIQHREPIIVNPEGNPALQVVSDQPARAVRKEHRAPVDVLHHPIMAVVETAGVVRTEVDIMKCSSTARVPAFLPIPAQHKAMAAVITGPNETIGVNSKTQQRTTAITFHFIA